MALSTMYFQRWQHRADLGPFFELGRQLGFSAFELSHILSQEAVAGVDPRQVAITAVHDPCPRPGDWSDGLSLSSANRLERRRAVQAVEASVRTAARLDARAVVLHLGRIEEEGDGRLGRLRFELVSRFQAGQADSTRFRTAAAEMAEIVAGAEPAHMDRALTALEPALALARDNGLQLAIETGYHPDELPSPAGMAWLLDTLADPILGAWLDTGHVTARAYLSGQSPAQWAAPVQGRWIGAHLHDAVGLRDHLVPGRGQIDFPSILADLPPTALLSLEVDWYHSPDEVAAGAAFINACLGA